MSYFDDHYEDFIRELHWEWGESELIVARMDDKEIMKKVRETIAALPPYKDTEGILQQNISKAWGICMNGTCQGSLTEAQRTALGKFLLYYGKGGS